MFDIALELKSKTFDSPFEQDRGNFVDVQENICKMLTVYFKVRQSQIDSNSSCNEELSAILQTGFGEIPTTEKHLLLSILNSNLSYPICGDLLLSIEKDSSTAKIFKMEDSAQLNSTLNDSVATLRNQYNETLRKIIVPEVAPDSLLDLTVSVESIESVISRMQEIIDS